MKTARGHVVKAAKIFLWSIIAMLGLTACKPVDLLNLTIPRKGYSVFYDIAYGPLPSQILDVYVPDHPDKSHSTILFFYGGSWQFGNKNMYRFIGQALASKGYTTVIINYRLYPAVYFPAFMEDGAKALHWVHDHIQQYGGSPNHIFLAGHSAGAHIAALLITDQHYIQAEKADVSWIKGMVGIAGPYDFLPFTDPQVKALFSTASDEKTQPINYVKEGLPPFLLVTGDKDTTVYPKNTINFANKLRQSKVPVTEIIYPGIGHIGIILSLASGFRYKTTLLQDLTLFIESINNK